MSPRFDIDIAALDALPPDERRQAIAALGDLTSAHQRNPLYRFDPLDPNGCGIPHLPQHRFMEAHHHDRKPTKFRVFAGGNRSGKTTAGAVLDIIDCIDEEAVPPHLRRYKRHHTPISMFFVAPTQRTVETIHVPIFRQWCPKDQLVGNSLDKALNREFGILTFKNGSTIQFMTQKMEREAFQGAALSRVHFDEEPLWDHGQGIFGECMQRLVDTNGDIILTFTPLNGMTWVYDKFYLPWSSQQPDREAAQNGYAQISFEGHEFPLYLETVDQDDNPTLDPEGKAAALAMAATDEERLSRKSGRFVSFAGRVFDDFSRSKHVVPDQEVIHRLHSPDTLFTIGGLDPGFRQMAGVVWGAWDHDGLWVFPELALERTVIADVAREAQIAQTHYNLPNVVFMADPAIAKIDAQTGKTDQQVYHENNMLTRASNNDVRTSINAIRTLLATDMLHVGASCEVLIEQLLRYRWRTVGRSEDDAPPRPVKRDDHLVDALRYLVMALPLPTNAPTTIERTHLQRLLHEDIARAHTTAPALTAVGPGQFE